MWPNHPEAAPGTYPPLPLYEGDSVIALMPDQSLLTAEYTARAVRFIERHAQGRLAGIERNFLLINVYENLFRRDELKQDFSLAFERLAGVDGQAVVNELVFWLHAYPKGLQDVCLHIIFDGRSTPPGSAPALLQKLEQSMTEIGIGQVVSGVGRGIALDRDGNYAKIQKAYEAMVLGHGEVYR